MTWRSIRASSFALAEAVRGEAHFRLETADGRVLAQAVRPVRLLTRQEWGGPAAGPSCWPPVS